MISFVVNLEIVWMNIATYFQVLFISEKVVIGVGFDCNPMVFAADERGIWYVKSLLPLYSPEKKPIKFEGFRVGVCFIWTYICI